MRHGLLAILVVATAQVAFAETNDALLRSGATLDDIAAETGVELVSLDQSCGCASTTCGDCASGCCDSCDACCDCCDDCCCDPWVPFMIGDALSVPATAVTGQGSQFFHRPVIRPSTNNSPYTRDRLSFEYRFFNNAMVFEDPLAPNAGGDQSDDLDMFVLRGEKTFFDGMVSGEIILPFMVGPAAFNTTVDGNPNERLEVGDLTFGLKCVMLERGSSILTAGLQIETPTAPNLSNPNGGLFDYDVSHEAWHFTPYIAAATTRGRGFVQGFLAYRMATQDEAVFDPTTQTFSHMVRDPDALMFDASYGALKVPPKAFK